MSVYLIMVALIVSICFIQRVTMTDGRAVIKQDRGLSKLAITVIFLILVFVAAFRYGVGTDFYAYYKTSNWTSRFKLGHYNEPGFTVFALACNYLFNGANGAITIMSSVVVVSLFVFTIVKRSEAIDISVFLYIFIGCFAGVFNGVRQYMAAAILFAGYRFVVEKKLFKWLFIVLLASTFHVTAILVFFIYFICNLRCNWWLVMLYAALAVALLFSYDSIFELIGGLKQTEFNPEDEYMTGHVNILRVLVQCVPIVMFLFVKKSVINGDRECRFLFNISLLNAAFAIAAMNSPYFSRFCIYTSCFQILMYPKIFSKMIKDNKNIFTVALLACYGIFWIYEMFNNTGTKEFHWIFNYL